MSQVSMLRLQSLPHGVLESVLGIVDNVTDLHVEAPVLHHLALVGSQINLKNIFYFLKKR